mgnify:CR=1 FL=1
MSESASPFIRYTKTFKKYTGEFEPRVVDYVREWAQAGDVLAFHEDNSIVKVTGSKERVDGLLATLKERFNYIPPEDREDASSDDEADDS